MNVALPEGIRTGLVPVEIVWLGRPLAAPAWVRDHARGTLRAARHRPSPTASTCSPGSRIVTRLGEGHDERSARTPTQFHATVDGHDGAGPRNLLRRPVVQRYEFNFKLPANIAPGPHEVRIALGKREFAPLEIEVA